jgi:hypothetical protein
MRRVHPARAFMNAETDLFIAGLSSALPPGIMRVSNDGAVLKVRCGLNISPDPDTNGWLEDAMINTS